MKNTKSHAVLGLVLLTVFLDIVGFSIIFPLFPDMLDHYLEREGPESWLGKLAGRLGELAGSDENATATLFGGILGSVYALLQFVFAPIWGGLSDRIGRRPTLLFTLTGTVVGYVLWVFSGSFAILILARVVGGIMAGNISTATAIVADVTKPEDRAKGMGMVGAAIGMGFILGPVVCLLALRFNLFEGPWQAGFATNPFSMPALAACLLSVVNLLWVWIRYRETLDPAVANAQDRGHPLNPFGQLRRLAFPGLARTNVIYLLFLTAFSAMEFTLVFLAAERFDYSPTDNAKMFVFVGFVIALVQGGLVRRLVPRLGERKVALIGLTLLVPAFVLVGWAQSTGLFYFGLFLMAVGSALVMPSLSSLVSRYAPMDRQGLALGTFRSMGSLARVLGPILGGILYWKWASATPYLAGAVFLLVPLALMLGLPAPSPLDPEEAPPAGEGGPA